MQTLRNLGAFLLLIPWLFLPGCYEEPPCVGEDCVTIQPPEDPEIATGQLALRATGGEVGWQIAVEVSCDNDFHFVGRAPFITYGGGGTKADVYIPDVPAGSCAIDAWVVDEAGERLESCYQAQALVEVVAGHMATVGIQVACSAGHPGSINIEASICWLGVVSSPRFDPGKQVVVPESTEITFEVDDVPNAPDHTLELRVSDPALADRVALESLGGDRFRVTCLAAGDEAHGWQVPLEAVLHQCGVEEVAQHFHVVCNPSALLLHYTFDDPFTAVGRVIDQSGNGWDAEPQGAVEQVPGVFGQAIRFTGDWSSFIQTSGNPLAGSREFTAVIWFSTARPWDNIKLAAAAWWHGGLDASGWILATHACEFWSDIRENWWIDPYVNGDGQFLAGEWNQLVIVYRGATLQEYNNGLLINEWQTAGLPVGSGSPLAVGAWPQYGFNLAGAVDDFRLYDRALTQAEIEGLYAQAER